MGDARCKESVMYVLADCIDQIDQQYCSRRYVMVLSKYKTLHLTHMMDMI